MGAFLKTPKEWPLVLTGRAAALSGNAGDLDLAVRNGAFEGLRKAVRDLGATGTIATVAASGLRGRGGAGFPTGEKWRAAANQPRRPALRRRQRLRRRPVRPDRRDAHGRATRGRSSRAIAIAAFAIGATEAIIAVRAEDTALVTLLEGAIARGRGGAASSATTSSGSGYRVTVTVRPVQGAYMLGEETVLLKALEGKRGQPEQRPPYPTERGLFGRPTVVNNVQTLAAVPWIIREGAQAFAAIGSTASPGTALVQLRGPAGAGIAEVPLGHAPERARPGRRRHRQAEPQGAARRRADRRAAPRGPARHAVRVRRPARGRRPHRLGLDRRRRRPRLRRGPRPAAHQFSADEACGKTIPCRIGLRRLYEIGDRVATGTPKPTDAAARWRTCRADIVASALCDHERLATLPFTSGMRYFRSELDDHLLRSTCPAGVCHPIAVGAAATPGSR